MPNDSSAIVSKVWNYAHVLKNAGVGYGDYVEVRAARALVTCLLFLKLADEMTELGFDNPIPAEFGWSVLSSKSGDDLEVHYRYTLENLGKVPVLVGTGGFLLAAHDYISEHHKLDKAQRKHLKTEALWGTDIVPGVVSLCAMNMYLRGIGKVAEASSLSAGKGQRQDASATIDRADALGQPSGRKFDMILANPPFGKMPTCVRIVVQAAQL